MKGDIMKKHIGYIAICLLIGVGLVVSMVSAFPQAVREMRGSGLLGCPPGPGFFSDQLTEEQQEALHQLIQELRDSGATPEEIREAVMQFLEEQGIDTEEMPLGMHLRKGMKGPPFADQLTEEQQEALHQLIQELRDSGATPEEIREAVMQFLEEQGIEIQTSSRGNLTP
jgi:DNA-binding transcriptional regulator YhcF (GntR family)